MIELALTLDSFNFYFVVNKKGYEVLEVNDVSSKFLKKGKIFSSKELAQDFLEKYTKQGTYLTQQN